MFYIARQIDREPVEYKSKDRPELISYLQGVILRKGRMRWWIETRK